MSSYLLYRDKNRDLQRHVQMLVRDRTKQAKTPSLLGSAPLTAHRLQDVARVCPGEIISMVTTAYLRLEENFHFYVVMQ